MPMEIPVIDLDVFITGSHNQEAVIQECKKAADALIVYGALVLHDSRVAEKDNATFLDLMEDYFNQPLDDLRKDERSVLEHRVGFTERATGSTDDGPCPRPTPLNSTHLSPNSRFTWHMSKKALYETQGQVSALTSSNVVPSPDFLRERWTGTMDQWGQSMKNAVADLADMIAIGLDLPAGTFREAGQYGAHILAPTSTIDLVKYGQKGTILTGFHSDYSFLTIHGRSRYPCLDIWARNTGQRIGVEIPPGYNFLVQAGKQLEYITGGLIKGGLHEIAVNDKTLAAIERRKMEFPDRPLIRVSSTFFWNLSSDYDLVPIAALKDKAGILRAKNIEAGLDEGDEVVYEPMKVRDILNLKA